MTKLMKSPASAVAQGLAAPSAAPRSTLITVAPNGAYKQRTDHPSLPLTAYALAQEAKRCLDAGAGMIHLHVRTTSGEHLLDATAYAEATTAIHRAVGQSLVVQVTTEAGKRYAPAAQMAVVRSLRPEAASFSIAELVPDAASEVEAAAFFDWVRREGILPQYVLYSPADLARYHDLKARGILPGERDTVLFVLGRYAVGQCSDPRDLLPFLTPLPEAGLHWSVCAFGPSESACVLTAAALGGHVRVGFENNLWLADGRLASDNAALVAQAHVGIRLAGRVAATADDVRGWKGN
ncbi:MAG: 3-keto-5-aminohexanoate cleavage protein [Pseudomonadota bacterium]